MRVNTGHDCGWKLSRRGRVRAARSQGGNRPGPVGRVEARVRHRGPARSSGPPVAAGSRTAVRKTDRSHRSRACSKSGSAGRLSARKQVRQVRTLETPAVARASTIVFTTYRRGSIPSGGIDVLDPWYPLRSWQVELVFRVPLQVPGPSSGTCRSTDEVSAQAWLYGKLLDGAAGRKGSPPSTGPFPLGIRRRDRTGLPAPGVTSNSP